MRGYHAPIISPKTTFTGTNSLIDFINHLGAFLSPDEKRALLVVDKDLVKFSLKIPARYKVKDDKEKIILRKVGVRLGLPKYIIERKKKAIQYSSNSQKALKKLNFGGSSGDW